MLLTLLRGSLHLQSLNSQPARNGKSCRLRCRSRNERCQSLLSGTRATGDLRFRRTYWLLWLQVV